MATEKSFADYKGEGHLWITLASGEYYPDVLPLACELYKPVLILFGQLVRSSHSSTDLFMAISGIKEQWMRVQLSRVFRKYVSPETPVEMLKRKCASAEICEHFGSRFRPIAEVQRAFEGRPMPDEALWACPLGIQGSREEGIRLDRALVLAASRPVARTEDHRAGTCWKGRFNAGGLPGLPKA